MWTRIDISEHHLKVHYKKAVTCLVNVQNIKIERLTSKPCLIYFNLIPPLFLWFSYSTMKKNTVRTLKMWKLLYDQCSKLRCIFQHSRRAINAHRANTLNIGFVFWIDVFTNSRTPFALMAAFSFSQKRTFSFTVLSWTYLTSAIGRLQFDTSIALFNWREIVKGLAFICKIICSKKSKLKSAIWLQVPSLDSSTNSSFILASFPRIVVGNFNIKMLISSSAIVCGVLDFAALNPHLKLSHQQWFVNRYKT